MVVQPRVGFYQRIWKSFLHILYLSMLRMTTWVDWEWHLALTYPQVKSHFADHFSWKSLIFHGPYLCLFHFPISIPYSIPNLLEANLDRKIYSLVILTEDTVIVIPILHAPPLRCLGLLARPATNLSPTRLGWCEELGRLWLYFNILQRYISYRWKHAPQYRISIFSRFVSSLSSGS